MFLGGGIRAPNWLGTPCLLTRYIYKSLWSNTGRQTHGKLWKNPKNCDVYLLTPYNIQSKSCQTDQQHFSYPKFQNDFNSESEIKSWFMTVPQALAPLSMLRSTWMSGCWQVFETFNDKGQGHIKLSYLHFLKPLLHSIAIDNIVSNLDKNISILIPLPLLNKFMVPTWSFDWLGPCLFLGTYYSVTSQSEVATLDLNSFD